MANCDQDRPGSVRICAGCRSRRVASELIRLTGADGRVVPDIERRLGGRGAHLCVDRGCAAKALKRGSLSRTLRRSVRFTEAELQDVLGRAFRQSFESYVFGALRNEPPIGPRSLTMKRLQEWRDGLPGGAPEPPIFTNPDIQARATWLMRGLSEFTSTPLNANNPPPCRGGAQHVN